MCKENKGQQLIATTRFSAVRSMVEGILEACIDIDDMELKVQKRDGIWFVFVNQGPCECKVTQEDRAAKAAQVAEEPEPEVPEITADDLRSLAQEVSRKIGIKETKAVLLESVGHDKIPEIPESEYQKAFDALEMAKS